MSPRLASRRRLFVQMLGAVTFAALRVLWRPRTFRFTSLVNQIDLVGWRAVPIILLITFLIGAILAQQGIFHFRRFGADIFVVDMVGILTLREVGVLIVCVMVAGRSGSAYTAELGSMKMREEIDALQTMGFDPISVLVLPRILALIIAVPMLTFLGEMSALYGAGLVASLYGDIPAGSVPEPAARSDLDRPFHGRHDQGAVHGAGHRHRRLRARARDQGQRGIARHADHQRGGAVDLSGDRAGRHVRGVLRGDRQIRNGPNTMSITDTGFNILSLFEDEEAAKLDISQDIALRVRNLQVKFQRQNVLKGVNFDVKRGEVLGFVGASGAGKSVLLRTMIGLIQPSAGTIEVFGQEFSKAKELREQLIERHWGILFQHGALFSALTVRQNVQFPMREYLDLSPRLLDEVAAAKLKMVGLPPEALNKMPSELSGGMIKRVALARALALDPAIVFLDEPTSGLDPISAGEFDNLIRTLQRTLGLTVFMVTHDLDSLHSVCDRIAVLADGKVIAAGPMSTMLASEHPWLKAYFRGKRGRVGATM